MHGRTKQASHLRGTSSFLQARVLEQEVLMTSPMILIGEMMVLVMGFMNGAGQEDGDQDSADDVGTCLHAPKL